MRKMNKLRLMAFVAALVLSLSAVMTAFAYQTIPYGERSNRVRQMQKKLKAKGYYKGAIDGKFGAGTKAAVRKFQAAIGITVDGHPGDRTLTALYEGVSAINGANNTQRKQQTNPENPNTLYYGCTGARVRSLQRALRKAGVYGGSIDGVYGDLTYQAVRKYQSRMGLRVDGMAGVKTLSALRRNTGEEISTSFLLAEGSKGSEVKSVARRMYYMGKISEVTDVYTSELARAVKDWQASKGYPATGSITQNQYNDLVLD